MMNRKLLISIILCCLPTFAFALKVAALYTGEIAVTDHSKQQLNKAVPLALQQVFTKVSGNSQAATVSSLSDAVRGAGRYVLSYRYLTQQQANNNETLYVDVRFDSKAVLRLLRDAGQAVWSDNRPQTIAWVAVQTTQGPEVISSSSNSLISKAMQQAAQQRGIPLLMPLMDLQDQTEVSASGIWNLNPSNMSQASSRYDVQDFLIGNIVQNTATGWQGNWVMNFNGDLLHWQTSGNSPQQVAAAVINNVADAMANRYAVIEDNALSSEIQLNISGVSNLSDYAKVIRYLNDLVSVTKVQITAANANTLTLMVNTAGGENALLQALSNSKHLLATAVPTSTNSLDYQWITNN